MQYWVRALSHPKNEKNLKKLVFEPRDYENRVRSVRFTPYGFITKEFSRSVRPFSALPRVRRVLGPFSGLRISELTPRGSKIWANFFMKARFTLCLSTVRRGSVSHPIPCRFRCPSSVCACFRPELNSCKLHTVLDVLGPPYTASGPLASPQMRKFGKV